MGCRPAGPTEQVFLLDQGSNQRQVKDIAKFGVDRVLRCQQLELLCKAVGKASCNFIRFSGRESFALLCQQLVLAHDLHTWTFEGKSVAIWRGTDDVIIQREPPAQEAHIWNSLGRIDAIEIAFHTRYRFFQAQPDEFHAVISFDQHASCAGVGRDPEDPDILPTDAGSESFQPGRTLCGGDRLVGKAGGVFAGPRKVVFAGVNRATQLDLGRGRMAQHDNQVVEVQQRRSGLHIDRSALGIGSPVTSWPGNNYLTTFWVNQQVLDAINTSQPQHRCVGRQTLGRSQLYFSFQS